MCSYPDTGIDPFKLPVILLKLEIEKYIPNYNSNLMMNT